MPTLIAVPYKFMGKPYYHERRMEVERDLSAEQKAERDERQSTWGRKKRKHGETQKLIIKGRSAVDPDAGEEHQRYMHVLDEGDTESGVPAICKIVILSRFVCCPSC